MDELTARRLAHNEAVFREVNEQIEENAAAAAPISFVCECSDADCLDRIALTHAEYEAVRSDPRQFVVASGHERPELERVVLDGGGYRVVEKLVPPESG